jgi:pilus assembly protein CpaF
LRVPARREFSLHDLVAAGSLPPRGAEWIRGLLEARLAFLVTGGTGSGKTTVLGACLGLVDPGERLVIVEDSAELRPAHPHAVRLEARPPNVEGAGEITLRDLVRQALRMRPDRLVVGEVRGAEVVDLLAAMNTGHEGGCATVHANSAADMPARLEALAVAAGLSRAAVHSQIAAGIDAVVHVARDRAGQRRLTEIGTVIRSNDGLVEVRTAIRLTDGQVTAGPAFAAFRARLAAGTAGQRRH